MVKLEHNFYIQLIFQYHDVKDRCADQPLSKTSPFNSRTNRKTP